MGVLEGRLVGEGDAQGFFVLRNNREMSRVIEYYGGCLVIRFHNGKYCGALVAYFKRFRCQQ